MSFDWGATGGGATIALEHIIRQKLLEQQQRAEMENMIAQRNLQARGQDITAEGQRATQARFDTERADKQAAAAEQQAQIGKFVAANPQLGRLVQLNQMGVNVSDPHKVESETEHAPHVAAERSAAMDTYTQQQKIQTDENIRQAKSTANLGGGDSGQFTSVQQMIGPDGKPALMIVDRRTGRATPVQAPAGFEPNRPPRPVLGAERTALGYFNRMLQAERDARLVEDKLSGTDLGASELAPGFLENWLKSEEGQKYSQAQRAYTEARLRKESGAAIPQTEFESDRRTAFRVLNDKPELVKQKRGYRLNTMRGIGAQAGRALQEFYGEDATLDSLLQEFAEKETAAGGRSALDILNSRRGQK